MINKYMSTCQGKKKEELEQYCKKMGISMNEAMNRARELLLVDSLKSQAPDQAASIEDFELSIDKLLALYKMAVDHSITARAAAEKDVKGQLEAMSALVESNKALQSEKSEMASRIERQTKEIEDLKRELSESKECVKNTSELEATIHALKSEIIDLKTERADLITKHAEQIAMLQDASIDKILSKLIKQ